MDDPYLDMFQLNIKLKPSNVVDLGQGEEEPPGEEEEESKDLIPKFKFTWWCKEGFQANIQKIVEEYNEFRGLKPIKIFLTGPPASGKTYYGTQYNLFWDKTLNDI